MGDRVALIGGSTPGRDHFPFPVEDVDPDFFGTAKPYPPLGLTLEQILHLLYHCRTFRITVDTITYAGGPTTFAGFTGDITHLMPYPSTDPATRESWLVVYSMIEDGTEAVEREGGGLSYTYLTARLNIGTEGYGSPVAWESDAPHVQFEVRVDYDEEDTPTEPSFDFIGVSTYDYFETDQSAGTLTILTNQISTTLPLYKIDNDYEVDITVECIEYWPYATRAGDPVYDTADGSQLEDPLS